MKIYLPDHDEIVDVDQIARVFPDTKMSDPSLIDPAFTGLDIDEDIPEIEQKVSSGCVIKLKDGTKFIIDKTVKEVWEDIKHG